MSLVPAISPSGPGSLYGLNRNFDLTGGLCSIELDDTSNDSLELPVLSFVRRFESEASDLPMRTGIDVPTVARPSALGSSRQSRRHLRRTATSLSRLQIGLERQS